MNLFRVVLYIVVILGSIEVWEHFRSELLSTFHYLTGINVSQDKDQSVPFKPDQVDTTVVPQKLASLQQVEQNQQVANVDQKGADVQQSANAEEISGEKAANSVEVNFVIGFADVVKRVATAVVNVASMQQVVSNARVDIPDILGGGPFDDIIREFFGGPRNKVTKRKTTALGSGFIVQIEKEVAYVVTNYHVVENATQIVVYTADKTELRAVVYASDSRTDIAVLAVDIKGLNLNDHKLTTVKWGDSDKIQEGNFVIAIGNPFGLGSTVTHGIISAKGRNITLGKTSINFVEDFIQHSAQINMGNSGGALLNAKGEVIGINNAIFSMNGGNIGIGFAIPSNISKATVDQLIAHKRTYRGWLGAEVQQVGAKQAESVGLAKGVRDSTKVFGAYVSKLVPGGPAEKAGLKVGDIVIEFNGKKITEEYSLHVAVGTTEIGKSVPVKVWRQTKNGEKWGIATVTVRIGDYEKAMAAGDVGDGHGGSNEEVAEKETTLDSLGITVSAVPPQFRGEYPEEVKVIITKVDEDKCMSFYGPVFLPGDGFISANNRRVTSVSQLKQIMDAVVANKSLRNTPIPFVVMRNGSRMIIATTIDVSQPEKKSETSKEDKSKKGDTAIENQSGGTPQDELLKPGAPGLGPVRPEQEQPAGVG
ncbi:MAG: trypsin-like peptidase domain-containing protein [Holosporales bacterium]|jgi:serine protease Do|nr:trypsin-like peptidase domain-containing protein [Holosporales bacterium]